MSEIPVVILCGGRGTRMGDTLTKKELIDIGGRPLLWHVMRIFSAYGHNRFILALGHHADQVRRYFLEYDAMSRDTSLHIGGSSGAGNSPAFGSAAHAPWEITLVDTGLSTERASRLNRLRPYLTDAPRFFFAYGEAVADIDLAQLVSNHLAHRKQATITGIQVNFQYGVIDTDGDNNVSGFAEKPRLPHWINGGFMLFERNILELVDAQRSDQHEQEILTHLAQAGELKLYRHTGYWQSMKTLHDAMTLRRDWEQHTPWKVWEG